MTGIPHRMAVWLISCSFPIAASLWFLLRHLRCPTVKRLSGLYEATLPLGKGVDLRISSHTPDRNHHERLRN